MKINYTELLEKALQAEGTVAQCYSVFHQYSFRNMILLCSQFAYRDQPLAPVATFKKWQELNRQVKKGSKALAMYVPMIKKEVDKETGEEKERFFFYVRNAWFSLNDTTGEDVILKTETPVFSLSRIMDNLGIKLLPYESTNGNAQGYCTKSGIAINPVAQNPIKTALHEIGHFILHSDKDDYHDERGLYECEAESTALLAGMVLGVLDEQAKSNSVGYIKGWMRHYKNLDAGKMIERCAKNIFSAVDKILIANKTDNKQAA